MLADGTVTLSRTRGVIAWDAVAEVESGETADTAEPSGSATD